MNKTSQYFPKGFDIFPFDDNIEFFDYILKLKNQYFGFLPNFFLPCISYKNVYDDNFLNSYEMFEISHQTHKLVLAPEYTAFIKYIMKVRQDIKGLTYIQPCFRREKPQAFRQRQFLQLGLETRLLSNAKNYILFLIDNIQFFIFKIFEKQNIEFRIEFNYVELVADNYNKTEHYSTSIKKQLKHNSDIQNNHSNIYIEYQNFINNLQRKEYQWNTSLYRGLGYYKGLIMQIYVNNIEVGGGGMYDDKYFGFAFGLSRLYELYNASYREKFRLYTNDFTLHSDKLLRSCSDQIILTNNKKNADIIINNKNQIKYQFKEIDIDDLICIIKSAKNII